jgi:hypothetical protein
MLLCYELPLAVGRRIKALRKDIAQESAGRPKAIACAKGGHSNKRRPKAVIATRGLLEGSAQTKVGLELKLKGI